MRRWLSTLLASLFVAVAWLPPLGAAAPEPPSVSLVSTVHGAARGVALQGPRGVALDLRRGEILVANTGEARIEIYDLRGHPRAHFTHLIRNRAGQLVRGLPTGLLIDPAGRTLVVDPLASYVDVLDFRGRSLAHLDLVRPAGSCPSADMPAAVALTPGGEILVASGGAAGRVYRFDQRYRPIGCWGESGNDIHQLSGITGLSVLPDGNVVVISGATRFGVQVFTASGEYVRSFGPHEVGPGNFSLPSGVIATADGRIWVSDEIRQVIQVFDAAGQYLGDASGTGGPNALLHPNALASDGRDYLAVSERTGNRVQLFRIQ